MSKRTIQETLRLVRERIETEEKDHPDPIWENEIRTRYVLIDPMLRACVWDLSNPEQVTIEAKAGKSNRRIDYRLNQPDGSFIYIEARLFTDLGLDGSSEYYAKQNMSQLRGYVRRKHDGTAVLTDSNI